MHGFGDDQPTTNNVSCVFIPLVNSVGLVRKQLVPLLTPFCWLNECAPSHKNSSMCLYHTLNEASRHNSTGTEHYVHPYLGFLYIYYQAF